MPQDGISNSFGEAVVSEIDSVKLPDAFRLNRYESTDGFFSSDVGQGWYSGKVTVSAMDQHGNARDMDVQIRGWGSEYGHFVDPSGMRIQGFTVREVSLLNADGTSRPLWQDSNKEHVFGSGIPSFRNPEG